MIGSGGNLAAGTAKPSSLQAGCGLGLGQDWRAALKQALDGALAPLDATSPDLLMLFVGAAFADEFAEILAAAAQRSGTRELAGCSASGVIGLQREVEDAPGIAALSLQLPSGSLLSVQRAPAQRVIGASWVGMSATDCHGLIVLADPFSTDVMGLIEDLEHGYPEVPIVGGLATGQPGVQTTSVFCGPRASSGAVVIGLGGSVGLRPVVSQGCEPIGESWTITDADGHLVRAIGGRPAYEVLRETVQALDALGRTRARNNLLVGLAMNEYRDEFRRGDFLIRNLMGVDPQSGAIAVAAQVRVGQTLQFQIRDAQAADEELRKLLDQVEHPPAAALLFACNGRGIGLFGAPDHDAQLVRAMLGPLALAGLFCNGEIGPVGGHTFVHGFTASLALIASVA